MAVLLAFNTPAERRMRLSLICAGAGARIRFVKPEESGLTLGMLAGLDAESPAADAAVPEAELLVLCGFNEAQANKLLGGLKQARHFVRLKAVLTPTNRSWLPAQLAAELVKEDAAVRGGGAPAHD